MPRRQFIIKLSEELGSLDENSDEESDDNQLPSTEEDEAGAVGSSVRTNKRNPCTVICKKPKINLSRNKCYKFQRFVCGKCEARTLLYCKLCK